MKVYRKMCIRDSGNTAQADTEPVPAQDGEDESDGVAAILLMHISGNIVNGSVVALSTGYNLSLIHIFPQLVQ